MSGPVVNRCCAACGTESHLNDLVGWVFDQDTRQRWCARCARLRYPGSEVIERVARAIDPKRWWYWDEYIRKDPLQDVHTPESFCSESWDKARAAIAAIATSSSPAAP